MILKSLDSDFQISFPAEPIDMDYIPEHMSVPEMNLSANEEVTFTANIVSEDLSRIIGYDPSPSHDFMVECNGIDIVQVRRHKKKRINKKWAKRYGFKPVLRKLQFKACSLNFNEDGSIDFVLAKE